MTTRTSLDAYFEIAVRMEENGERFYRRAAKLFEEDDETRELLVGLADAEVAHRETFQRLRANLPLPSAPAGGPPSVGLRTLMAMAESQIFAPDDEPGHVLSGQESVAQVLHLAIEKEKDTVLFYQALQDAVTVQASRDRIVEILMEEIRHVTSLRASLVVHLRGR